MTQKMSGNALWRDIVVHCDRIRAPFHDDQARAGRAWKAERRAYWRGREDEERILDVCVPPRFCMRISLAHFARIRVVGVYRHPEVPGYIFEARNQGP